MVSPFFQIGQNIGQNLQNQRESNTIEKILSDASQSQDPAILQKSIGKILSSVSPERQGAAVQYLQGVMGSIEKKKQQAIAQQAAKEGGYTYGAPEGVQTQQVKNQQPAKPEGGLSGQAVPPEVATALEDVVKNNPSANADQLAIEFDKRGIPRAFSNNFIENRRRQDESKKPGQEFAALREKSIADYVNNSFNNREEAENLRFSLDESRKALQGDITGPGITALAKNNPYTQLLIGLTPDEALLQASNKKLLEGSKGIFGSKPTEREIFLLLNSMLPSIGKSKEANLAGLNFIERINDLKLMHSDLVDELTEGGTKFIPDLEKQVNSKMRSYGESLRKDLQEAVSALEEVEKESKPSDGKILVIAPDGTKWEMTQKQIDDAKSKKVNFEPIK